MADDDDPGALRLNTLDRFRKQSPRLLLEEYSHCEVPAGCGGVILRWVDPQAGVPAFLRVVVVGQGTVEAYVDGVALDGSRTTIPAGERVLGLALRELGAGPATVLVELQRGLGRDRSWSASLVLTRSLADGRWRAWPHPSIAEDWAAPSHADERDWIGLPATTAELGETPRAWQIRTMREAGTAALVLDPSLIHTGCAWIRHRFFVEALPRPQGELG